MNSMRKPENDNDRRLLADVRKYGWHTVGVLGDDEGPGYLFTVGLFHTFQHPELCIFGLSSIETMGRIINNAGEMVKESHKFQNDEVSEELLNDYACVLKTVNSKHFHDYFGYARWFYEGDDFSMLQCVWPDSEHNYPWDQSFAPELKEFQPMLFR
jgi:uncharacterized protein DUF4262